MNYVTCIGSPDPSGTLLRMVNTPELQEQLRRFQAELADAEIKARSASRRVESLRQVVEGLRGLMAPDEQTHLFFGSVRETVRSMTENIASINEAKIEPAKKEWPVAQNGEVPLRGRDAVRKVLIDTRRAWKLPALAVEIQRRGFMPDVASPRDAVAATTQRLVKDGEVERIGHGVYRYRLDKLPPANEEGG